MADVPAPLGSRKSRDAFAALAALLQIAAIVFASHEEWRNAAGLASFACALWATSYLLGLER